MSRLPKSQTWFSSDPHYLHGRIIRYVSRPFSDVDAMTEAMIRNWNDRVQPDHTAWIVGDFAFGESPHISEIFARLNGEKHLVIGNHDEDKEVVLSLPWASISVIKTIVVECQSITMCHYPMKSWPRARKGAIHLHGHMHGRLRGTNRSLDVGVDAWGFKPVSLSEIRQRLKMLPPDPDFIENPGQNNATNPRR